MNWLDEQYAHARREQEVRELMRQAEIENLVAQTNPQPNANNFRRAVGAKLIELGERLQDAPIAPRPSTMEI